MKGNYIYTFFLCNIYQCNYYRFILIQLRNLVAQVWSSMELYSLLQSLPTEPQLLMLRNPRASDRRKIPAITHCLIWMPMTSISHTLQKSRMYVIKISFKEVSLYLCHWHCWDWLMSCYLQAAWQETASARNGWLAEYAQGNSIRGADCKGNWSGISNSVLTNLH